MTHSVACPLRMAALGAAFVTAATMSALVGLSTPSAAQRATEDARPGGVELRPMAPPAPAGADMAPAPSMLFKKPTLTPPVLPAPAPALAPAAATAPVVKPATPPPAAVPTTEKPAAGPAPVAPVAPPAVAPPASGDKAAPAKPDAKKKAVEPPRTGATRSFRYEAPGSGAPAGAASEAAPAPSGKMKGDDRLPGGVERSPGRE